MYGIEKRLLMRRYLEEGVSKAATARALRISRRTIYNWIKAGELERDPHNRTMQYEPRRPRPSILDARLQEYPQLSAARLFRYIRELGFPGGYGTVKQYVYKVRRAIVN